MSIALKANKLIYIIEELSDNILTEGFAWKLDWKKNLGCINFDRSS